MYQSVTVIGHLGRDPEMRYTSSGVAVTSFSVATSRKWTDAAGAAQEKTTWFRVSAWRKLGETCNQYLHKGQLVMVEGEIDASAYTPKDGGEPRASLELTARTVKFLSRGEAQQEAAPADETDVPF
jgi:single-strand DNA-binding protein